MDRREPHDVAGRPGEIQQPLLVDVVGELEDEAFGRRPTNRRRGSPRATCRSRP